MRAGPVARWLVAVFLVFGVETGVVVEPVDDDERPAPPPPVLSETIDPGWAALDDLAVDELTSDPGKAALAPTAAVALGASTLGALLMRAARHRAAGWPGASPTRGPPRVPRVLSARSNSLPTAPSRPLQRSIKGRGPPARRLSPRVPRVLLNGPITHTGGMLMRLLSIAIATALVGVCGAPALAGECPLLQQQMARQVGNRVDNASYQAKEMMKEAQTLHQQGKHAESVAKYDEAAKAIGVTLEHKK